MLYILWHSYPIQTYWSTLLIIVVLLVCALRPANRGQTTRATASTKWWPESTPDESHHTQFGSPLGSASSAASNAPRSSSCEAHSAQANCHQTSAPAAYLACCGRTEQKSFNSAQAPRKRANAHCEQYAKFCFQNSETRAAHPHRPATRDATRCN